MCLSSMALSQLTSQLYLQRPSFQVRSQLQAPGSQTETQVIPHQVPSMCQGRWVGVGVVLVKICSLLHAKRELYPNPNSPLVS